VLEEGVVLVEGRPGIQMVGVSSLAIGPFRDEANSAPTVLSRAV
jgi:hypothetical protein